MEIYCVSWERVYLDDAVSENLHAFTSYGKAKCFLREVLEEDYKDHPDIKGDLCAFIDKHFSDDFKDKWFYDEGTHLDRYGIYTVELD